MKTKKLLSLILAVIMIMSVLPMYASAADPIALTADNITVYPTANGSIYFGQKINEGVTLSGGEVQYDGAVVAGHFEFDDPEFRPTSTSTAYRPKMIFVPDDTDTYTTFEVPTSKNTTFAVNKAIPVFVDENDTIPVATEVEPGAKLSTSTLSGAQVMNPYYPEESKALAGVWKWASSSTIVNESGYYEARITISGYERLTAQVYVKVASDIPETTIAEYPTISELTYDSDVTWGNLPLEGGKAVIKGTDTEVKGKFTLKDRWVNAVPDIDITEIDVVFTPDDPEAALPYEFKIPVKVNPCPISFGKEHKGTSIDDPFVFEVDADTKMSDVLSYIQGGILNYPTPSVVGIEDANSKAENGKIYKVTVINYTNTNYTGSEAYIKTVIKDVEFAASSVSYAPSTEEIRVNFNSNKAPGTFDVFVDGKLIGDDVKLANDHIYIPYKLATSGKHTVKVVYNPTENDYFFMADYETEIRANVKRNIIMENKSQKISVNGKETIIDSAYILNGDEISIKYGFEDLFVSWVITDASGKAVALDGVDLTSSEITFTMPDHDLVIAVKTTLDEEETPDDGTDDDADNGIFGGIWSFFQKLINWFINIIKQMMSLFAPKA